jgi:hypothetical protein
LKAVSENFTKVHNCNLKEVFHRRWKTAKIVSTFKPGKVGSNQLNKSHPISLLVSSGKVLGKLIIDRVNHHVYTRRHINENQFGFRLQKAP